MRLIDCFIELVGYVSYFSKNAAVKQPPFDQVRADIEKLITASQNIISPGTIPPEDFDIARFAVFSWIDEMIMNSLWTDKNLWQGELLQRIYYQTTDAGEIFFDKLNNLTPQQVQVREIFYLCLAMGFTGRYCTEGDEFLLDQLLTSNLKLITGSSYDIPSLADNKIFPDSYSLDSNQHMSQKTGSRFSIGLLAGISMPVMLYGALFFIYQFVLSNVGENFILTVP